MLTHSVNAIGRGCFLNIIFVSRKLQKEFNDDKLLKRSYGPHRAKLIRNRLADLRAADTLEVIRILPHHKCHELLGDRKEQISIALDYPYCLILEVANSPVSRKEDGGLDWSKITAVKIIEVVNYHG